MGAVWLVLGGQVPPSLAVLAAAQLAHRGGQRVRARLHRGGAPHRLGLPALRRQPRLRRHRVHRPAAAGAGPAARGGAGDTGPDAVLRPAPVLLPPPDQRRARSRSGRCRRRSLRRVAKLVAGRMPDPSSPLEALASFTLQRDYGVRLGTVITPADGRRFAAGGGVQGDGGQARCPSPPGRAWRCGWWASWPPRTSSPTGRASPTPCTRARAFAVATKGSPALTSYYVRLRHGQADFARFEARISGLNGAGVQDLDRPAAAITTSIHPQAVGWRVLAALAGLAAVAVVGQALARQASAESTDHPVLAALGLSPRQLAVRIMLRTLVVAVAGAAGGIAVATLLSPLAPLGEARLAEPAPGLSVRRAGDRPGRTGDGGRGAGAGRATGAACRPGAQRGRPRAGGPPVGGRGCRRGGGRAARRGHRHPARPGTGPRDPRGPGGNGADRLGGRRWRRCARPRSSAAAWPT